MGSLCGLAFAVLFLIATVAIASVIARMFDGWMRGALSSS